MTDPITIERSEIQDIVDRAIMTTLTELGIKTRDLKPYISKNMASKLVGRVRLEKAMKHGSVGWMKKDMDNPRGRVWILKRDLEKLIKDPLKK